MGIERYKAIVEIGRDIGSVSKSVPGDFLQEHLDVDFIKVRATARGYFEWGPLKYRPTSKKEHRGLVEAVVKTESAFKSEYKFGSEEIPEGNKFYVEDAYMFAHELAESLSERGFEVDFRDKNSPLGNFEDYSRIIQGDIPRWLKKRGFGLCLGKLKKSED